MKRGKRNLTRKISARTARIHNAAVQTVQLKSGKEAIVRPARASDVPAIVELSLAELLEADVTDLPSPEEFQELADQLKGRLPRYEAEDGKVFLVAEVVGDVVGMLHFENSTDEMQMHQGTLSMAVKRAWRDQGVGHALLQSLLAWGQTDPLIEKIRLEVFSTNERALALYTSLGFVEEGRLVKQLKLAQGVYVDFIMMYKFVK